MKLKIDDKGNAVLVDGKPVYIHDDGKEIAFDAANAMSKIQELNAEAKQNRQRAAEFEKTAKAFGGLDPEEAFKAIETVKNLDSKKLIDSGEMERVKAEIIKTMDANYKPFVDKAAALENELYSEKVGGSFARSKMIAEKLAIPADLVQARFGEAFKVENGQVVGYDGKNQIMSRVRPGEVADFDESLEFLIDKYPHRDSILKGSGSVGTGALGNTSGNAGKQTISRSAFNAMPPDQQRAHAIGGGQISD